MPIYEYRRPDGSTFEVMQSFSEAPLTHDPETGAEVQRVLHAPAVHFKGSGFYNTDYGTRRRQRENAAEEGASGKDSGKDGAAAGEKGATADSGATAGAGSESGKAAGEGKTASKAETTAKPKREPALSGS
jgi:putative FmdB family regulatory protein